jgi:uncharacterized protein
MKFSKWDIVFVRDCNLRCSYCSTGYGRFADSQPRELSRDMWDSVAAFMLSHTDTHSKIMINFQGGETFIRFDPFIEFVKLLKGQFEKSNIDLQIDVATNGVLLDGRRLAICLDNGINLHFSIDGDEKKHDLHRRDLAGRGTFKKAFGNWREYKKMSGRNENSPSCSSKSVATTENGLSDIVRFWNAQGLAVIDVILEERSFYVENGDQEKLDLRRKAYLRDLEKMAAECVSRSREAFFLTNFKGPMVLLSLWEMMLKNSFAGSCAAGEYVLGIDPAGNLFPCNVFVGQEQWNIGHVSIGIDQKALECFLLEKRRAFSICSECAVRQFCGGGCPDSAGASILNHNSPGGCDFMKEVIKIADSSFRSMCK